MNRYRVNISISDEHYSFYTRAENCRMAVGNFLLTARDSDLFTSNIISLCQEILAGALNVPGEDILVYDSENIKLVSARNPTIVPDKPGDDYEDFIKYTYQNLPKHMINQLDEIEVEWVLFHRDEFAEENSFYLSEEETGIEDENDRQKFFNIIEAAEYIYKISVEEEMGITKAQIDSVLQAAFEYEVVTQPLHQEEIINLEAIDLSGISSN